MKRTKSSEDIYMAKLEKRSRHLEKRVEELVADHPVDYYRDIRNCSREVNRLVEDWCRHSEDKQVIRNILLQAAELVEWRYGYSFLLKWEYNTIMKGS